MALLRTLTTVWRGGRLLRALLRTQEALVIEARMQTLALQQMAAAARAQVQQGASEGQGFVTGPPDGRSDAGLVRTSNQEVGELLEMEAILAKRLGRAPTDEETVGAWEDWKEGH